MTMNFMKILVSPTGYFAKKPMLKSIDISHLNYMKNNSGKQLLSNICDSFGVDLKKMSPEKMKQFNDLTELINKTTVVKGSNLKLNG